jgi:hypothetical protein
MVLDIRFVDTLRKKTVIISVYYIGIGYGSKVIVLLQDLGSCPR